jgi:hypothetical protein
MKPAGDGLVGLAWAAGNNGPEAETGLQTGPAALRSWPRAAPCLAAAAWLLLASCGGSPEPVREAVPFTDPGFAESADHRLHYALTMTSDLPFGIAGSYGIVPRRNLALLTLTLAPRNGSGLPRIDASEIEATAVTLTGERTTLPLVRHDEAGGPSWLATVEVRHRVPVTIDIRARATDASPDIRVRLTREFRLE